jgi:hypothetical protein
MEIYLALTIRPLSKEAYNETKLLYLSKKPTWYESINIIVNILKTTNTDINLLLRKNTWKIQNVLLCTPRMNLQNFKCIFSHNDPE